MEGYQILEQKLRPLKKYLNKNSINEKELKIIRPILKDVDLLTSLIYRQKIDGFQRVTVNSWIPDVNGRIEFIKHLKYPPKECVKKYGRANIVGQNALYGTFDPLTALSEMRPEVNDTISVSHWKLNSDYDLYVTPIFKNSSKDGITYNEISLRANIEANKQLNQYEDGLRKQLEVLLQFVADTFSKEVKDGNHYDYYLSAHYANRLLYEFEDGELDAILYPSVRQSLILSNIVIKPNIFDKYFDLVKVEESIILSKPTKDSNGWNLKATGLANSFTKEKVKWKNASG